MKTVFNTDTVTHLWANGAQSEARNGNNTVWFRDGVLYSYQEPIAARFDGLVLLNSSNFSVTTSRHQTLARRAVGYHTEAFYVPSLKYLSELRRQKAGKVKTFPVMAQGCVDKIVGLIASLRNMRSVPKMQRVLEEAIVVETAGYKLCEYVGAKKWPLPPLPQAVPADKVERDAFILTFAKAKIMAEYESTCKTIKNNFNWIKDLVDGVQDNFALQNLQGRIDNTFRLLNEAGQGYKLAKGRESAKVNRFKRELTALDAKAQPAIAACKVYFAQAEIDREIARANQNPEKLYLSRLRRAYVDYPDTPRKEEVERLLALEALQIEVENINLAIQTIASAKAYDINGYSADAARYYRRAYSIVQEITNIKEREDLLTKINPEIERLEEVIRLKEADKARAWCAGESNIRPAYEAGAFARVKGDTVQTSRGATVPLEHAVRLAVLARRVIRQGGGTWEQGAGPMVGHYRVISIDASGRTVIGCHTFGADEANRMIELLCKERETVEI